MHDEPATSRRERAIRKLAGLLVRGIYREVDVIRMVDKASGPQLSVSNHFGGFADPLLLIYALPRLPRIIARDVIWKIPVVRSIMNWLGALPVHKSEDRGPGSNDVMFRSAYDALADGLHLLIFPEGITRDEPSIAPIKTGAARIAMGARASGVGGISINPAGIHYEDKASLRSSVTVLVGQPIDVDTALPHHVPPGEDEGPDNWTAVRSFTDTIETALRRVAPDFSDWEEARILTIGAEIVLRTLADDPADEVPLAVRDALAGHLGRVPSEAKEKLVAAVSDYDHDLSDFGLSDATLLSGMTGRRFLIRSFGLLLLTMVLLPFALVGAVINAIPYLLVRAVGLLRVAPAVLSTIKPLTAIASFGLAWGITAWLVYREAGARWLLLALMLLPLYLAAVIAVTERLQTLWASFRT
jgi:glycerol-3-phosphate O-acyltransferase/dihydroxyacetone phosphate acyltransferase